MAVSACPHGRRRVGRVSGAATACRLVVSDWRASAGRTSWGSPRAAVVAKAVESPYSGRVTALIGLRDNLAMARLHLITDLRGGVEPFVEFLDQMFNAGVDMVQVRDTGADSVLLDKALEAAVQPTFDHRKLLCVGRNVAAADALRADLLHLGSTDGDIAAARKRLHQWSLVGRSVHNQAQLDHAVAEQADWLSVGPVYGQDVPGLDLVRAAAQQLGAFDQQATPWFAVGGITLQNLDEVLAAGASRVAVSAAITRAEDPAAVAAEFSQRLRAHWNQHAPAPESVPSTTFTVPRRADEPADADAQLVEGAPAQREAPGDVAARPAERPDSEDE